MVTLKEIAQLCDVSPTTVSNVINGKAKTSEETRQKILQVIDETGFKPNIMAKGLRIKSSRTIAIIAEDLAQFTSPPIIESIMEACEQKDYRVIVHNLRLYDRWQDTWYNKKGDYNSVISPVINDILSAQIDGVIYVAGHARVIKTFNDNFELPVVMCYAFSESSDIPSVVIDDEKGSYDMVSYLISKGHKRIGFVGGRMDNLHTVQRLMGYQKAMFENGLLFDPNLVYYGDWSRQSGYDGASVLIKQNVSAFFGIADRMTGGIYDYLYENEIEIGRGISVASFDNENISEYFKPRLTTTELPLREIGKRSAELLLNKLEKKNADGIEESSDESEDSNGIDVIKVPCRLVIRDSVTSL
ncbi:MAG: LacI family DNA-binding transcriptional regulator [Eubacterium sp.]|nr:LacI family DNA-binding transcriptional regulator [Eubacterium sp.]